ncbi:MAG: hypothetical protein COV76_04735 [Candidatus Omnitrophica bacterium CG11_big_fil_rev_8_21_14_0_20_64_10]|nr:MAG: hypothetical protein COV76_04735 [Candidatus Omnitrophica bacterium CG11_big_fil_rev_8_21_14_0_20_64_10]
MLCDLCGQNEASVHLSEVIDGESREIHLCQSCAEEKGIAPMQDFGLADLLGGLAAFPAERESAEPPPGLRCSVCGMAYADFRKTGRLGCAACYEAFRQRLTPLLNRIHGSTHHVGKSPASRKPSAPKPPAPASGKEKSAPPARRPARPKGPRPPSVGQTRPAVSGGKSGQTAVRIEELKVQLKEAVAKEDFEKAAQLRDRIRILEKKPEPGKGKAE